MNNLTIKRSVSSFRFYYNDLQDKELLNDITTIKEEEKTEEILLPPVAPAPPQQEISPPPKPKRLFSLIKRP